MSSDANPDPNPQDQGLNAAGNDADANGGSNEVGDPIAKCPGDETGPVWVRLQLTPEQAATNPGSLHLAGGGYDATLAIASSFQPNGDPDNTVDVVFEGCPIKSSYTLTYVGSAQQIVLVSGAPYSSLQDDSLPPGDEGGANTPPENQT